MKSAVVLMAYGSPERLADVPAYYSDIRGGRPIAPEHLADLVERYRRLGIEDSSPLNAITEQTRAALAAELGLPVFTGMKHWTPRIADAAEAALASGAEEIVGLVLAPHYSSLSIAGYRGSSSAARGPQSCASSSWHDSPASWSCSPIASAAPTPTSSYRALLPAHSPGRDPYRDQLLETSRLVAGQPASAPGPQAGRRRAAVAGAGHLDHPRSLRQQGVEQVIVCPVGFVSDH